MSNALKRANEIADTMKLQGFICHCFAAYRGQKCEAVLIKEPVFINTYSVYVWKRRKTIYPESHFTTMRTQDELLAYCMRLAGVPQ